MERGRIVDTHYEMSLEILEDSKLAGSQQEAKTDNSTLGYMNRAEPVSRLREEIIFLYSALWAIFSHCLVWGPSNTQKTPTNVRQLSRGHWHDGAEAGGDKFVQLQAGTALDGHNSTSSAYGDVTEKSRDGVFTAVQDKKGKNNRQKLKQER